MEDLEVGEKKINLFDVENNKCLEYNFRIAMNRFSSEFQTSFVQQGQETILLQNTGKFFGYHGILFENISSEYLIEITVIPREFVNLIWLIDNVEFQNNGTLKYLLLPQTSRSIFFRSVSYNSGYNYNLDYNYRYQKNVF